MKRDGRTLDHATFEALWLMAVERVRHGEAPSTVITAYRFNRTTIYRWLKAAAKPGMGHRALRARQSSGRPRSLTPRLVRQVFRWVNGKDPANTVPDYAASSAGHRGVQTANISMFVRG
jgi:transposase